MIGLSPLWWSVIICGVAAGLEGVSAGRNVSSFFKSLRFPRYALPTWAWALVGAGYYGLFGFLLYRIMLLSSRLAAPTLALAVFMMVANALSNIVIFRKRDLRLAFLIGAAAPAFDLTLFACMMTLDRLAALAMLPYLFYRAYAVWWGYAVWKLNTWIGRQD